MYKIIVCGCFGKMGRSIIDVVPEFKNENLLIVGGIDSSNNISSDFPVFKCADDINIDFDTVIDFSSPSAFDSNINFLIKNNKSLVLGTTGFSDEHIKKIFESSKSIPILWSYNMSLLMNLILFLAKKTKKIFGSDFDIEIIEKHHNKKVDAPSGTAIMIADFLSDEKTIYNFNRANEKKVRSKNEIGIHSIRGGNLCGEHEILFAGDGETFSMTHTSYSRKIFARGAIVASIFLKDKKPNLYRMNDVLKFND